MVNSLLKTTKSTHILQLMGCIIGKGGSRIKEVRQLSGAHIDIERKDDVTDDEENMQVTPDDSNTPVVVNERKITIGGSPESICFAQYLINFA